MRYELLYKVIHGSKFGNDIDKSRVDITNLIPSGCEPISFSIIKVDEGDTTLLQEEEKLNVSPLYHLAILVKSNTEKM